MSETISGGLYRKPDGSFVDASGKPVKLTPEIRKQAKAAGIKLPTGRAKPAPAPEPESEPEG